MVGCTLAAYYCYPLSILPSLQNFFFVGVVSGVHTFAMTFFLDKLNALVEPFFVDTKKFESFEDNLKKLNTERDLLLRYKNDLLEGSGNRLLAIKNLIPEKERELIEKVDNLKEILDELEVIPEGLQELIEKKEKLDELDKYIKRSGNFLLAIKNLIPEEEQELIEKVDNLREILDELKIIPEGLQELIEKEEKLDELNKNINKLKEQIDSEDSKNHLHFFGHLFCVFSPLFSVYNQLLQRHLPGITKIVAPSRLPIFGGMLVGACFNRNIVLLNAGYALAEKLASIPLKAVFTKFVL
jgi:hypothetical protein